METLVKPGIDLTSMVKDEAVSQALEKINTTQEVAVEGCHYAIVRHSHLEDLSKFIGVHFTPDETLASSINMPYNEEMDHIYRTEIMKKQISLILISNTTQEIVGMMLIHINSKASNLRADISKLTDEGLKKINRIIRDIDALCDIYDYYNCTELIRFLAFGVHRNYRSRGIGTKVMKAAVLFVQNLGLGDVIIKGEGSSRDCQRCHEKLGFDLLAEIKYKDHKENGEVVFKTTGDQDSLRLYGKAVSSK